MKPWLFYGLVMIVVVGGLSYVAGPRWPRTADHEPPRNFVALDDRLATAGQPSGPQLAALAGQGFELIVNLAPLGSYGALADEEQQVRRAGMGYVHIPVDFERPTRRDFDAFRRVLQAHAGRKILVHCQLNMRASAFAFLYRVVHAGVAPQQAFEAVSRVWAPNQVWRDFMNDVLAQHRVAYEVW
jgi:uncharacterized protein (TIGR01244 family)